MEGPIRRGEQWRRERGGVTESRTQYRTGHEGGALDDCENGFEEGKTLDKSKRVDPGSRESEVETRCDEVEGLRGKAL